MAPLDVLAIYFRTLVCYNYSMNKSIKYRLYPTNKQAEYFFKCFGGCRFVYNQALNWRIAAYNADGTTLSYNDTAFGLTALKRKFTWLNEVDSVALQQSLRHLDCAFNNFFKKQKGFPKFKSAKHSRKSYKSINQKGTVAILGDHIKLPKAGAVKAKVHREPLPGWRLKSATVSMDNDGKFYVSCLFEFDKLICVVPSSGKAIGLDYKSDGLYMDSNGDVGSNHKYFRESHAVLTKEQRRLRHKTTGSNNYRKQPLRINRIHKHIANQRLDNLHKLSTEIANQYDVVCVEGLNMQSVANRGFGNGRATMDNGYGMFLNMLEYKLSDRGKLFVKVDKWFPSTQLCSCCGGRLKLAINERIYKCSCGLIIDRDLNAAINIRNEGLRIIHSA